MSTFERFEDALRVRAQQNTFVSVGNENDYIAGYLLSKLSVLASRYPEVERDLQESVEFIEALIKAEPSRYTEDELIAG